MQTQTTESEWSRSTSVDAGWESPRQLPSSRSDAHGGYGWKNGRSIREAGERRARFLGWFSLALGVSEVVMPDKVARLIGVRQGTRTRNVLRALGLREIASGVALLTKSDSASAAWSRVLGDAMDLALLGTAMGGSPANRARLLAATGAVAGVAAMDVMAAAELSRSGTVQKLVLPVHVVRTITINRSPELVYQYWRNVENLPRFMAHLESVRSSEDGTSVWRAKAPAGTTIEWRAEITLDLPNEAIGWRSIEGSTVPNRGVVRFKSALGGRGTEVRVELKYDPPGGAIGAVIAKLFGEEPSQQIAGDLRRLKQVLETGDVVHSDASIHRGLHAAQPAADDEEVVIVGKGGVQ